MTVVEVLFCRYARSQNAHLRRVNSAFSSFASLKLTQFYNFVSLANDCCGLWICREFREFMEFGEDAMRDAKHSKFPKLPKK